MTDTTFQNISATTAAFELQAGAYTIYCKSPAWGGGSITLEKLARNGVSWPPVTMFRSNEAIKRDLAEGTYRFALDRVTRVDAGVAPIPEGGQ